MNLLASVTVKISKFSLKDNFLSVVAPKSFFIFRPFGRILSYIYITGFFCDRDVWYLEHLLFKKIILFYFIIILQFLNCCLEWLLSMTFFTFTRSGIICKIGKLSTSCKSMFKRKDSYIEPRVTQFFILKYPHKQELTFVVCYLPYNFTFFKGSFM